MRKTLTALAATATIAVASIATPTTADARWGWWGPALGGLAVGAIIGSALKARLRLLRISRLSRVQLLRLRARLLRLRVLARLLRTAAVLRVLAVGGRLWLPGGLNGTAQLGGPTIPTRRPFPIAGSLYPQNSQRCARYLPKLRQINRQDPHQLYRGIWRIRG